MNDWWYNTFEIVWTVAAEVGRDAERKNLIFSLIRKGPPDVQKGECFRPGEERHKTTRAWETPRSGQTWIKSKIMKRKKIDPNTCKLFLLLKSLVKRKWNSDEMRYNFGWDEILWDFDYRNFTENWEFPQHVELIRKEFSILTKSGRRMAN